MVRRGNAPFLDIVEHNEVALAKRALMVGLDSGGSSYLSPSVFDYVSSDPLAVVLVNPTTGVAYSATAGGESVVTGTVTANLGIARDVTAYVAASEPIAVSSMPSILGTVTANLGVARDVTAHLGGSIDLTIGSMPNVAGTVTAHAESRPSVYTDIRTRTVYVPTESGAARQLNILTPGPWGWAATSDPSNAEAIYFGPGSSVNSTVEDANSGWALYPGQTVILPMDNMTVYAVCPTVTGKIHLMTVV